MAEQEQPQGRTFNHSGWRFTRINDWRTGAVQIAPPGEQWVTLSPETWASIVASLGQGGETHANWRAALAFHQDAHMHGEPTHIREARDQVIMAVQAWQQARAAMTDAYENRDTTIRSDMAIHRAMVECYDAEERLIDLRAILTALQDKYAARRSQPQAPEGDTEGDPGDEAHTSRDTSPAPAHRPPQDDGVQTLTVYPEATPGTYVPPAGTVHTLASVSGIAPAQLQHLAKLGTEADIPSLQGWFTRNGERFNLNWDNANKVWIATWLNAKDACEGQDGYLLNALLALATAVLHQARYNAVTYVTTPQP